MDINEPGYARSAYRPTRMLNLFMCTSVREGLEAGMLNKDALPHLLFKNYKFDESAPEELCGALHPSGLLLWAYQQAHTGSSSVGKQGHVAKGSNSQLAGQKSVNSPSIGFAAIVLRHTLSATSQCDLNTAEYDYNQFYKQIVAFLEKNKNTPAGKRLFEQWNARVYGTGQQAESDMSITALVEKAAAEKATAAAKAAAEKAAAEKAAADRAAAEGEAEREAERERLALQDTTNGSA
ncbi:hypothetical protein AURDEDRAFT_121892 [Auricularia subglabra TFB-10046 SS5]|nr:hypothetical protein AURDEDRAFT_121892 [Auricularia subglabra TFB-10046 SS5]